jgi:hypothetical protein
MEKSSIILVEDYTVEGPTTLSLDNYPNLKTEQIAYIFNITQKLLYAAPTETYAVASVALGIITIPGATMANTDIIHIQIWEDATPPLSYMSTALEKEVIIASELRLYSFFVMGSGNSTGYIQLWDGLTLKGTYPINNSGNISLNLGQGLDFSTSFKITNSSQINTIESQETKYIFDLRYELK